ncbi:hypothetical protein DPMN_157411 [Dreissena polymorpha]|uniref:Uncharacterized protein n=1 Tax=Dreissena polymorpha TaxID=45954 RepID=A0A9D4EHU4_DREPO|nr:hypothetical protein DPMN_157411 [Dreissena polymorpha]
MPRPIVSHVFQANIIIFELIQDIIETNLLTKFHGDLTINVASRVLTRKNSPPLTKFHDDRKINVTSRVLTSGHAFLPIRTIFELNYIIKTNIFTNFELGRDFIGAKLLTKFHEDGTRNVASRVFTCKCLRRDIRRTKTGQKSSPEQSGELKILRVEEEHRYGGVFVTIL